MGVLLNPYRFKAAASGPANSVYRGSSTAPSGSATTKTFSAVPITPITIADKVFAILVSSGGTGSKSLVSATIGGVPANIIAQGNTDLPTYRWYNAALIAGAAPVGTTTTITGTYSGAVTDAWAHSFAAENITSLVALDTAVEPAVNIPSKSFSLDTGAGGVIIGGAMAYGNANFNFTNWTKDYQVNNNTYLRNLGGRVQTLLTETRSLGVSRADASNFYGVIVAASFR